MNFCRPITVQHRLERAAAVGVERAAVVRDLDARQPAQHAVDRARRELAAHQRVGSRLSGGPTRRRRLLLERGHELARCRTGRSAGRRPSSRRCRRATCSMPAAIAGCWPTLRLSSTTRMRGSRSWIGRRQRARAVARAVVDEHDLPRAIERRRARLAAARPARRSSRASLKIVTTTEISGFPDRDSATGARSDSRVVACATRAVCLLTARNATESAVRHPHAGMLSR